MAVKVHTMLMLRGCVCLWGWRQHKLSEEPNRHVCAEKWEGESSARQEEEGTDPDRRDDNGVVLT